MAASCPCLARVIACMKRIAPLELADHSWDNVGLLLESPQKPEASGSDHRVLLTIDLTMDVVEECIEEKVNTVITYHPTLFHPLKRMTLEDPISRVLLHCAAHRISIYSPHTSLDACIGGINDWIARSVGVGKSCPIEPAENQVLVHDGAVGMGRLLKLEQPEPLSAVWKRLCATFGVSNARICASQPLNEGDTKKIMIQNVAICAGSGGTMFSKMGPGAPVDLFITGEMTHHQVLSLLARRPDAAICLFEHTNTERGYLSQVLQPRLEAMLSENSAQDAPQVGFQVMTSTRDRCPIYTIPSSAV